MTELLALQSLTKTVREPNGSARQVFDGLDFVMGARHDKPIYAVTGA